MEWALAGRTLDLSCVHASRTLPSHKVWTNCVHCCDLSGICLLMVLPCRCLRRSPSKVYNINSFVCCNTHVNRRIRILGETSFNDDPWTNWCSNDAVEALKFTRTTVPAESTRSNWYLRAINWKTKNFVKVTSLLQKVSEPNVSVKIWIVLLEAYSRSFYHCLISFHTKREERQNSWHVQMNGIFFSEANYPSGYSTVCSFLFWASPFVSPFIVCFISAETNYIVILSRKIFTDDVYFV